MFRRIIFGKAPIKHLLTFLLTRDPQVFPQLPIRKHPASNEEKSKTSSLIFTSPTRGC
jgi:hypothetical protein